MRRLVLAVLGAAAALIAAAGPAAADPARPTNVGSHLTGITPATPQLSADLAGAGAFVHLRVRPGTTVIVFGYQNEPYLRIDADGTVAENTRSTATYLNRSLSGNVAVPAAVDPNAPPEWKSIAAGGEYAWHDHRVHWMASGGPPERQAWTVPLLVDGAPVQIEGWYASEAAPNPAPWWLLVTAVLLVAVALGWRHRAATAAMVVVAAALGVPVAVAIARLPASGPGDWTGVVLLALAIVGGLVAMATASGAWLAGAGVALLLWAARRLNVLDHAVLVTALPEWLDRLAVAVGCGVGVGAVVIGVRAVLQPVGRSVAPRPG